ncbi:MAG: hypothetical protein Q7R62_01405 [bacterium]|nr:hypothetical protein [bacterium]
MKNIMNTLKTMVPTLIKRSVILGVTLSLLQVSFAVAMPVTGIDGSVALKNEAAVTATDDFGGEFHRHMVSVSMYNNDPAQTDSSPNRTANGDNLLDPNLGPTVAMNGRPFGTMVYVPALGKKFRVNDRMNPRYNPQRGESYPDYMDIFLPIDPSAPTKAKAEALRFGRQTLEVIFLD